MNKRTVPQTIEEIDKMLEELRREWEEKKYKRRIIEGQATLLKRTRDSLERKKK